MAEETITTEKPEKKAKKAKASAEVSPNSVKEKQQNYSAFSEKLSKEADALLREGKKKMAESVSEFNSEIESQRRETENAVKKLNSGIRHLQEEIKSKNRAFETYSKQFWG
jgi:gas vesicle protein